jgi:hypothetical protein
MAAFLSEIDSQALCYPAFPLVVLLRKSYKDGVNRCPASTSYAFEVRSSQTPVELMPPAAIRAPGCSLLRHLAPETVRADKSIGC